MSVMGEYLSINQLEDKQTNSNTHMEGGQLSAVYVCDALKYTSVHIHDMHVLPYLKVYNKGCCICRSIAVVIVDSKCLKR